MKTFVLALTLASLSICSVYKKDSVKNCLNESRYDFYKVKSLKITALDTCSITCNDGSTDSCTVQ
jgi:hypothetical protein